MFSRGVNSPPLIKVGRTLRPPLPRNLFVLPSLINISMTRHHKQFHPTPSLPGKFLQQACRLVKVTPHVSNVSIDEPMSNFAHENWQPMCPPMKSLFWKKFFPYFKGERQHETKFLLNVLIACDNK